MRDRTPEELQKLLGDNNVQYNTEPPEQPGIYPHSILLLIVVFLKKTPLPSVSVLILRYYLLAVKIDNSVD